MRPSASSLPLPALELVQTLISPLQRLSRDTLEASARELRERALTTLGSTGLAEDEIEIRYALDMRYRGQGYDVTVPIDLSSDLEPGSLEAAFKTAYWHRYGVHHQGQVETRACRLQAHGPEPGVTLHPSKAVGPTDRRPRTRRVWFDEGDDWFEAQVICLPPTPTQGMSSMAPLVIEG